MPNQFIEFRKGRAGELVIEYKNGRYGEDLEQKIPRVTTEEFADAVHRFRKGERPHAAFHFLDPETRDRIISAIKEADYEDAQRHFNEEDREYWDARDRFEGGFDEP